MYRKQSWSYKLYVLPSINQPTLLYFCLYVSHIPFSFLFPMSICLLCSHMRKADNRRGGLWQATEGQSEVDDSDPGIKTRWKERQDKGRRKEMIKYKYGSCLPRHGPSPCPCVTLTPDNSSCRTVSPEGNRPKMDRKCRHLHSTSGPLHYFFGTHLRSVHFCSFIFRKSNEMDGRVSVWWLQSSVATRCGHWSWWWWCSFITR